MPVQNKWSTRSVLTHDIFVRCCDSGLLDRFSLYLRTHHVACLASLLRIEAEVMCSTKCAKPPSISQPSIIIDMS